ncbi:MAG: thcD2 [Acidimicrobiales bacterium]|nr:thcD2 [Acidimicrobiales bacterium]
MRRIVVVGASLAGLRAAEALREEGFDGPLTVIGDEPHRPYDRPPLSKQVLAGAKEASQIALPVGDREALDLTWRLGVAAVGLDLVERRVALDDGSQEQFDGLVIATGATPRRIAVPEGMAGVHTLRTIDDCLALRDALDAGASRVVVVGAGFIGAEVAATCRGRGAEVTLLEALPVPLGRVLGEDMGRLCGDLHRDHGVDLRTGAGVAGFEGGARVEQVRLSDGSAVPADVVVVGVGVTPNTGWLEGSGLALDDGVLCDETTLAAPGVVAAGDVARWPNGLFGEVMRVEHWDNAIDMGAHAARRLLDGSGATSDYRPVPWFWSDQYDRKLQLAGRPGPGDQVQVVAGSVEDRRFTALYGRAGRVVGALGWNMPARIVRYRSQIATGLSWDAALADA